MSNFDDDGFVFAVLATTIILVVIIVIVGMIGNDGTTSAQRQAKYEFEQRDAFVQECVASERYSREDCVIMSGWSDR